MTIGSLHPLLPVLLRRVAPGIWGAPRLPADAQHQLPGWRLLDLDLDGVSSREEALAALGDAGGFPDHYGHNWDAAYDCLSDLVLDAMLIRNTSSLDSDVWSMLASIIDDVIERWHGTDLPTYVLWEGLTDRQQLPLVV